MPKPLKALLQSWDRFWFSRFDPISVSIFRIFFGFLILLTFLCSFPNWERFYAADGIISLHDAALNAKRPPEDLWCTFSWTEGFFPIKVYGWIGIIAAFAFMVGWQTRLAAAILYVLQTSMIHRNLLIVNGEDLTYRMFLFYACFSPLNDCLSVDCWLKQKREGPKAVQKDFPSIWAIRAMQINVLLIYVISVPNKLLNGIAWRNGEAIYWFMASNLWGRGWFTELFYRANGIVSKIATYGTIAIEASFPILVWFRKTKLLAITMITLLHLGIAVFIPNVTFFTLSMACAFWIFVPAASTRHFLQRLPYVKECHPLIP